MIVDVINSDLNVFRCKKVPTISSDVYTFSYVDVILNTTTIIHSDNTISFNPPELTTYLVNKLLNLINY